MGEGELEDLFAELDVEEPLDVELLKDRRGWSVEVTREGDTRRYRYGSEAQARFFAAVFALGPRVLPPVTSSRRKRTRRAA